MIRSMEEEFQRIVGVSAPLWGFVLAFMLFNVKGSNLYFWIAIIPVTLVLLVGAKLQHVIATLALESAGITGCFPGTNLKPRDELFWFKKPELLLSLIHFVLFQLLEPDRYTSLLKALYGLLMLLPQQSAAFMILRTRLKAVPSYSFNKKPINRTSSGNPYSQNSYMAEDGTEDSRNVHNGINFASWLQRFGQMQQQDRLHSKAQAQSRNNSGLSKVIKWLLNMLAMRC